MSPRKIGFLPCQVGRNITSLNSARDAKARFLWLIQLQFARLFVSTDNKCPRLAWKDLLQLLICWIYIYNDVMASGYILHFADRSLHPRNASAMPGLQIEARLESFDCERFFRMSTAIGAKNAKMLFDIF